MSRQTVRQRMALEKATRTVPAAAGDQGETNAWLVAFVLALPLLLTALAIVKACEFAASVSSRAKRALRRIRS